MQIQKQLKPKQIQAIRMLARGEKKIHIAQQLSVTTMTLHRWEQLPSFQTQLATVHASGLAAIARLTNAATLTAIETVQECLCDMREPASVRTRVALSFLRTFPAVNATLENGLKHRVADFHLADRFKGGNTFDSRGYSLLDLCDASISEVNPDGSVSV